MEEDNSMKYIDSSWSEEHKALNKIIRKKDSLDEAKEIFLHIHGVLHCKSVSNAENNTIMDELLEGLEIKDYAVMPTAKDETIAWVIWHIARIEDLTMNILVNRGNQIFNEQWAKRLGTGMNDTGNAWSDDEIISFSQHVNISELIEYRNEVGKATREIVRNLMSEDMKRKPEEAGLRKIMEEGGLTEQTDSVWLLDFWGNKDVAGLLLMPPTRHVTLHLNDCFRWKEYIMKHRKG